MSRGGLGLDVVIDQYTVIESGPSSQLVRQTAKKKTSKLQGSYCERDAITTPLVYRTLQPT